MKKKYKITGIVTLSLFLLYTLGGFFLVPYLVEKNAKEILSKEYGVSVEVKKIYFNPFTFYTAVDSLHLKQNNTLLLSLQQLQTSFQPFSLVQKNIHIQSLFLDKLILHPTLSKQKKLNFLEMFVKEQNKQTKTKSQDSFFFTLDSLNLKDAAVFYTDLSTQTPYKKEFGPLSYSLKNFTTKPNTHSKHNWDFDLGGYGQLVVDAKMTLSPLKIDADIQHSDLNLTNSDYLLHQQNFVFNKGILNYSTKLNLSSDQHLVLSFPQTTIEAKDITLQNRAKKLLSSKSFHTRVEDIEVVLNEQNTITFKALRSEFQQLKVFDNFVAPKRYSFDNLFVKVLDFSQLKPFVATMNAKAPDGALIDMNSSINLQKQNYKTDAKIQNLQLKEYQPYLDNYVNLFLKDGLLTSTLSVTAKKEDNSTKVGIDGDITLAQLDLNTQNKQDIFDAKKLFSTFTYNDNFLEVQKIDADKLHLFFISDQEGTNFDNLFVKDAKESTENQKKSSFDFAIKKVAVDDSAITIKDKSDIKVEDLDIELSDIAKDKTAKGTIRAKIDGFATAELQLALQPFDFKSYTRLQGSISGVDMKSLSPYAYNTIGREIHGGRYSDNFELKIEDAKLDSTHEIVINSLKVSQHLPQSEAKMLPINLAIALLQNSQEVINLDLELKNNLNAPDFKVRNLIVTVLSNVIVKTVSSPFSLLGSLVGMSGADLSYVEFKPASSTLEAAQMVKLDSLAKVLQKRPELKLEICSFYDKEKDMQALKQQKLDSLLQKDSMEEIAKEYGVQKEDKKQLQNAVLEKLSVTEDALKTLAKQRAAYIYEYLLNSDLSSKRVLLCNSYEKGGLETTFKLTR